MQDASWYPLKNYMTMKRIEQEKTDFYLHIALLYLNEILLSKIKSEYIEIIIWWENLANRL